MSKNILFLIDRLLAGGTERVVLTLAKGMAQQGHAVTILALHGVPSLYYPIPEGVRYYAMEELQYRGLFYRQTEVWRQARALNQTLATLFPQKKIDLAVSNLPATDRMVTASRLLKDAWCCMHCPLKEAELDWRAPLNRWRKKKQFQKMYAGRRILTVSHGFQEQLVALGLRPACVKTIYNPFDFEQIRAKAQEKCAFEGEQFLLHVGRLHSQKRYDRLFEAFKQSDYPGKLVLLGEGSPQEKKQLQQEAEKQGIADRVTLAGFSTNPYAVMRAAEALVLASDYEGLPCVLIEALICGTQIVSTNCCYGPKEILRAELAQGLAELTAPSLAAAIKRVLASPVVIKEEMIAPFTLAESIRGYLELIDKN